ncbi:zinc knuckle CX2CX4HX4C [Artemisia annua]|uniref:Zinc knuckle CX2CX4HX4C n=1 Tax=Artemisia annua TaxID=35608 RepID=A0A2U1QMS9_ARTAN|nr:zinc knuckle CX2CX4HX4C [Artemisia annua]
MSESNPQPPNPYLTNPNSIPPHPGSNEFVRTKRNTRHSSTDNKQSMKNTGMDSKGSLGVKKKSNKGSSRNKGLSKDMEGVLFEGNEAEDMEAKDDGSEGESELGMTSSAQGVTGDVSGSTSGAHTHGKTYVLSSGVMVNDGSVSNVMINGNMGVNESYVSNTSGNKFSNDSNEIHVPFELNPVLNPNVGKMDKSVNANVEKDVSVAKASNQWPSLSETVNNGNGKNNVEVGNKSSDTVMAERLVQSNVSFASAFKGLTGITTSMCEKAYRRASFARVLIEVNAAAELVDKVEVCYEKLGRSMNLKVEYAWKPPLCTHCKVFGHEYKNCSMRVSTVEEMVMKTKEDGASNSKPSETSKGAEEWQEARRFNRNGASTSRFNGQQSSEFYGNRGGFSNRGRGGYS